MTKRKLTTRVEETTYDGLKRIAERTKIPYSSRGGAIDYLVKKELESKSDGLNGNQGASFNKETRSGRNRKVS